MSHQHFCHIAGHYWDCDGKVLRPADTEPSTCICLPCGLPVEGFDHTKCGDAVELLACPKHREEALRRLAVARQEFHRRAGEFGLSEKCKKMQSLPEGAEKDTLLREIKAWILQGCVERQHEA